MTEQYNKLCLKCELKCKQNADIILLGCPNFIKKPQQIEIKFSFPKKGKKK
jgi:hypothetical protein